MSKINKLHEILREMGSVAVAFSGGVDSAFLAKVAYDVLGEHAVAITVHAELFPEFERNDARTTAEHIGIRHVTIDVDPLSLDIFRQNPPDRCYHCKKAIFTRIKETAASLDLAYVADGANVDDKGDYRPGARATAELAVRSPLLEAGFTKREIRAESKRLGLPTADKPSYACLASRIPYDTPVTRETLQKVAAAEVFLRSLGFRQFRVRHHGTIARIELLPEDILRICEADLRERVVKRLRQIGYKYVTLDLEGFRSGSLNEVLD